MARAHRAGRTAPGAAPTARTVPRTMPGWLPSDAFVQRALALLLVAGAALRLLALRDQPMVTFDGTEYVRYAEALRAGWGFRSVFAPGYPLLVAIAGAVIPGRITAAVAVSLLAGIALPAIVWAFARRNFGDRWALVPALACAIHLELARHSAITMSESAYTAFLYAALLAFATPEADLRPRRAALGGLALGFAAAIRPEGLVAVAALALAALVRVARGRLAPRRAFAAALACACVVAACVLWYHQTLGTWTLTPKGAALHAVERDWRAAEPRLGVAPDAAAPLAARVGTALRAWPVNARMHGEALLWAWPWPLLLLSVVGLARRRGLETAALAYLPLLPLLGLTQQERFALPAVPALAMLATVPLVAPGPRGLRRAAIALALFGTGACLWAQWDAYHTPFEGGRATDRMAGAWLAGASASGETVVDRKPFVAFYADRPHVMLPAGGYDAVLDTLVARRARWLVLQDNVAHHMRPELAPLLDSAAQRARESRIEMVYARADAGDGSLAIFRVLQPGEPKRGTPPVVETVGFAAAR